MIQPLIPPGIYCCDLDALIQLHSAKLFKRLRTLAKKGRLKIPEGISREAKRRYRAVCLLLQKWDSDYSIVAVIDGDHHARNLLPRMEERYGPEFHIGGVPYAGFWASGSGRKAADGQLLAFARANGWIVISNDVSVHGACLLENVACYRWEYLARLLRGAGH